MGIMEINYYLYLYNQSINGGAENIFKKYFVIIVLAGLVGGFIGSLLKEIIDTSNIHFPFDGRKRNYYIENRTFTDHLIAAIRYFFVAALTMILCLFLYGELIKDTNLNPSIYKNEIPSLEVLNDHCIKNGGQIINFECVIK